MESLEVGLFRIKINTRGGRIIRPISVSSMIIRMMARPMCQRPRLRITTFLVAISMM